MNQQRMQSMGGYEIIEEIGRGGMAYVYKAIQPSLNRVVALKVLTDSIAQDPDLLERFRREAQTAANLANDHIVTVYDSCLDKSPYFIAMELLQGGSLKEWLRRGPLSVPNAFRVLSQMAEALDYAHARRVVHRDVKPGNILFNSRGEAVVADFGIALLLHDARLTRDWSRCGTPEYMSPEQAAGAQHITAASDQYSLAVVFYEMVAGYPPFTGDPFAVMDRIRRETPPPLSTVAGDSVPPGLDAVLARALDKSPERRFPSCAAFAQEVRQVLAASPGRRARRSPVPPRPPAAGPKPPPKPKQPVAPKNKPKSKTKRYPKPLALPVSKPLPPAPPAKPKVKKPTRSRPSVPAARARLAALVKRLPRTGPGVATAADARLAPPVKRLPKSRPIAPIHRSRLAVLTAVLVLAATALVFVLGQQPRGGAKGGGGTGLPSTEQRPLRESTASPQLAQLEVPWVQGLPLTEAENKLREAGLTWEVRGANAQLGEGQLWVVKMQDPAHERLVPPTDSVTLHVVKRVKAPKLLNKPSTTAKRTLESIGLQVGTITYGEQRSDRNLVLRMSVDGRPINEGDYLEPGTAVDLVLSTKPPPPPPPPAPPRPPIRPPVPTPPPKEPTKPVEQIPPPQEISKPVPAITPPKETSKPVEPIPPPEP